MTSWLRESSGSRTSERGPLFVRRAPGSARRPRRKIGISSKSRSPHGALLPALAEVFREFAQAALWLSERRRLIGLWPREHRLEYWVVIPAR